MAFLRLAAAAWGAAQHAAPSTDSHDSQRSVSKYINMVKICKNGWLPEGCCEKCLNWFAEENVLFQGG
jgi:hypothetical protein